MRRETARHSTRPKVLLIEAGRPRGRSWQNGTGRESCRCQDSDRVRHLAGGLAHTINNLLTGVTLGSELALDRIAGDLPARAALKMVSRSGCQIAGLVRQLMEYAGIATFIASPQKLSKLVHRAIHSMHGTIPENVELRLDLGRRLPLVRADSDGIGQLIHELVINAVEAIGDEPGTIIVRTYAGEAGWPMEEGEFEGELRPFGDFVSLEVSDTGCGMETSAIRQVFDPFFTTKSAGRGLGLAAAAGIIRAHRGSFSVKSAPGAGTTFVVRFPASWPDKRAEEARAA